MAKKAKRLPASVEPDAGTASNAADKIAGALALISVRGMDNDAAAMKLDAIGFSAKEIAALLDVAENYVRVAKFRKRAAAKKKKG